MQACGEFTSVGKAAIRQKVALKDNTISLLEQGRVSEYKRNLRLHGSPGTTPLAGSTQDLAAFIDDCDCSAVVYSYSSSSMKSSSVWLNRKETLLMRHLATSRGLSSVYHQGAALSWCLAVAAWRTSCSITGTNSSLSPTISDHGLLISERFAEFRHLVRLATSPSRSNVRSVLWPPGPD